MLWTGFRHFHFPPKFEWLPLTTLGPTLYADQHFLFHILLIPFTWFGDLRLGAKVAAVLFGSAAVFSLYWLILRYRIRYPLLWLIALLGCGWAFCVRLNMTKAQSISIVFIVAGIILLFERKYVWLATAGFLYVWTYNLFVLLGVLAVIWTAVIWWSERKFEWRPLLWTAIGMLAGFVVNPFFPHNVSLFSQHLLAKSGQIAISSGVGFEWYPLSSLDFLQGSFIACAAMAVGYMAFGYALAFNRRARVRLQRPLLFIANYEPSTRQFRIRAREGNGIVLSKYADIYAVESAAYVVQPQDLPLYLIYACPPTRREACVRPLSAGEIVGRNLEKASLTKPGLEVPNAAPEPDPKWNNPKEREMAAEWVHHRFGGNIYGTVDERHEGGPALVVHNKKATG